jgi:hypothetical protein
VSDCNACIYTGADDLDPPDFIKSTFVTARKERKCCECKATIKRGQEYERTAGKWNGSMGHHDTCLVCAEIREAFCCDGWVYGQLWEDALNGNFFKTMTTGCLEKLSTAAAKEFLIKQWNDWKFS